MTLSEEFEWVALPAGVEQPDDEWLRLSVFVAPQIVLANEPDRELRLSDLPGLLDWPSTVAATTFALEVAATDRAAPAGAIPDADTPVGEPIAVRVVGAAPSSQAWRQLFPVDTPVIPFKQDDPAEFDFATFDAATFVAEIENGYADLGAQEVVVEDPWREEFWVPTEWAPPEDLQPDVLPLFTEEAGGLIPDEVVEQPGGDGQPDGPGPVIPDEATEEEEEEEVVLEPESIWPETVKFEPVPIDPFPIFTAAVDQVRRELNNSQASVLDAVRQRAAVRGGFAQSFAVADGLITQVSNTFFAPGLARLADEPELIELAAAPLADDVLPPDALAEVMRFNDFAGLTAGRLTRAPSVDPAAQEDDRYTQEQHDQDQARRLSELRESLDLHRQLSAIGEHPALLRTLGLVVDLLVPAAAVRAQAGEGHADGFRIRLRVTRGDGSTSSAGPVDRTPWTVATFGAASGFASSPDDGSIPGFALMTRYQVAQLEFEAGGIRLTDRANERAGKQEAARAGNVPQPASAVAGGVHSVPALRTSGLRLLEARSAERLASRAATANAIRAGHDLDRDGVLHADEVTRGYRLDVQDLASGHWYTLHGRRVGYSAAGSPLIPTVEDEGWFAPSFALRPEHQEEGKPPIVAMSDAVVTWDGWSLAATRPGKVVSADIRDGVLETEEHRNAAVRVASEPMSPDGLNMHTTVAPGTLPMLRFGREYRFRIRTVDLAGNALSVAEADAVIAADDGAALVTAPARFRRYEPVLPPVPELLPKPPPGERYYGEHERRLVVRTGLDEGDGTFGATPDVAERLLFPPKASVQVAEWHGNLDDAFRPGATPTNVAKTYDLAGRESTELAAGVTATPWLSDPASAGVCLHDVPGLPPGETVTLPWPRDEDGPAPVRLRAVAVLADEDRPPEVDRDDGSITVYLPWGRRATVQVTSILADEDQLALPDLWRRRLTGADLTAAEAKLKAHRHPLVTPSLALELVHATQRPVTVPMPGEGGADVEARSAGDTEVRTRLAWAVHGPTTGSVDVTATWAVPTGGARLSEPLIEPEEGIPDQWLPDRWVPDETVTTARLGTTTAVPADAATRAEVLVLDAVDDLTGVQAASAGAPASADSAPGWARVDLGTTAHTVLRLRATATSRFGDFFPPTYGPDRPVDGAPAAEVSRPSRLTQVSEPFEVPVLSTLRPPVPDVIEVLPLVVRQVDPGVTSRWGGWLRLWLAAPWFATGLGEALAVIVAKNGQPGSPDRPEEGYAVVTLAAPDPARLVPGAFPGLTTDRFDTGAAGWRDVRLQETAGSHGMAGVDPGTVANDRVVRWDPERGAWHADVRVHLLGGYFPFVRLAVARSQTQTLQTDAAWDVSVSPVKALDPIQVMPDRQLHHTVDDAGVTVRLVGYSYGLALGPGNAESGSPFSALPAPGRVRAILQRRVRSGGDELLAWESLQDTELPKYTGPDAEIVFEDPLDGRIEVGQQFLFDPDAAPGDYRLLVLEEEHNAGVRSAFGDDADGGIRKRVVYAEVVTLPRAVRLG